MPEPTPGRPIGALDIRQLRRVLGISRGDLGRSLETETSTVRAYETGRKQIPEDVADWIRHWRRGAGLDSHRLFDTAQAERVGQPDREATR